MAKVQVKVAGGEIQEREARTVGELARAMSVDSYTALVNGEPVDASYELSDYEFVSFAKPVKAG